MPEQRKLVAVMFTDIAGYTALMSADEQKALAVLEKNRTLQKSLAKKHSGEFLKEMGDGTLLCFQSALDAVRCAMAIQESVKDDSDLNLRIGIHLGDIVFKEGDVFGDGVNVASRIEKLAVSGGTCLSEEVYKSVRNQPDIRAVFLAEKRLKNMEEPIKIYRIGNVSEKTPGIQSGLSAQSCKEKSIIVLPFVNISSDPDQEYFSDGLTEEIITDLSHIHDLLVISRSSAMTFKGSDKKITEIAGEVNVRYVLEGSVRKAGNNLRITAQLIDAKTDAHLWAEKYSGTLDDVFDIQEKVSHSIADSLKIKLSRQDTQRITEKPIADAAAYECYLKANREIWRFTKDGIDRAIEYLTKAEKMIGENAYIYSALADAHLQYINIGVRQQDSIGNVTMYANKALAIDPDFPKAHAVLGWIEYWYGDNQRSVSHFKKALEVNPNEYGALHGLAALLVWHGKAEEAAAYITLMQQIDPLDPFSYTVEGGLYFHLGRYDKALPLMEKGFRMDPENRVMEFYYCWTLAYTGPQTKAFAIAERTFKKTPGNLFSKLCMILKYALCRETKKVREMLDSDLSAAIGSDFGYQYLLCVIFALLDEKEEALDWLEKAVSNGYINYPRLNGGDPFIKNIQTEARFKKLLKQVKQEWENFEV